MKKRISIILLTTILLIKILSVYNAVSATNNVENVINENKLKDKITNSIDIDKIKETIDTIGNSDVVEQIKNTIDKDKVDEIQQEITANMPAVKNVLSAEVIAIRDNAIAKLEEVEEEYNIDLTEYKNKIKEAVNKYQNDKNYTIEDLTAETQAIYNDLISKITSDEAKQKIIENVAQTYANIRAYVEKEISAMKNTTSQEINKVKEKYPELEIIEQEIFDKIQEYEDSILEMIEDFQEDPKGTEEELLENIKNKLNDLKNIVQKRIAQVRDFVKNGTPIPFDTLDGDGGIFNKENPSELSFRFKMWYLLFFKYGNVYVDDVLVDKINYTFKKGSTIVTLKEEYLNTLDNGEHTIKIALEKNKIFGEANARFSVINGENFKTEEDASNNLKNSIAPQTGDEIIYFFGLIGVSLLALVTTNLLKNYKKE